MIRCLLLLTWALGLLALSGCVTRELAPERVASESLSASWWAAPAPAATLRLRRELRPLLEAGPACAAARLREVPELAHALWLESEPAERAALAAALSAAGWPAYAGSAAALEGQRARAEAGWAALRRAREARQSAPGAAREQARAARAAFASAGDQLLASEASLLAAACALAADEPLPELEAPCVPVQAAQAALLRLAAAPRPGDPEPALAAAYAACDAAALERLVEALGRSELRAPADPGALQRARATLAAQRGEGERTLLAADLALREAERRGGAAAAHEARLLLGQGRLLVGQAAAAALEASAVAEAAEAAGDDALRVRAEGLLGQALWARQQPEAAAEAYGRAARAARHAGDPVAQARAQLNRASALLAAQGDLEQVEECLVPVPGASPEASARRELLAALVDLLRGRATGQAAAARIELSLDRARAAGAYALLARYGDLPTRLRARATQVSAGG